jgi:hypothetical protein
MVFWVMSPCGEVVGYKWTVLPPVAGQYQPSRPRLESSLPWKPQISHLKDLVDSLFRNSFVETWHFLNVVIALQCVTGLVPRFCPYRQVLPHSYSDRPITFPSYSWCNKLIVIPQSARSDVFHIPAHISAFAVSFSRVSHSCTQARVTLWIHNGGIKWYHIKFHRGKGIITGSPADSSYFLSPSQSCDHTVRHAKYVCNSVIPFILAAVVISVLWFLSIARFSGARNCTTIVPKLQIRFNWSKRHILVI